MTVPGGLRRAETGTGNVTHLRQTDDMARGGWRQRALWRTRPYLAPYHRHIVFIVISSIVSSAGMVAVPLIVKEVVDGPLADGDRDAVFRWAPSWPIIALLEVFLAFGRRLFLTVLSTGFETNLRDDLYAQLQRLDVGFHDRWQSGQLLSRAMTDLSVMRRFVGFGAIFFVLILVQVAGIFGVLLTLHVPLALLTFAATIPVLILCHRFDRRYMAIVRRIQDQTGDLTTTLEEGAKGIRVLKAFGRGDVSFAKVPGRGPADPRHADGAHHAAHAVRVGARRCCPTSPSPWSCWPASWRWAPAVSASAASSPSCPTC